MAEKILALLIAFVSGIALTALVGTKLVNFGLRLSPPLRKLVRDKLDREDARHALVGAPTDNPFNAGVEAAIRDAEIQDNGCQLCIDPIDKPYVDEGGAQRWRACPNPAAHVVDHNGHKLRVCEDHFQKGARR